MAGGRSLQEKIHVVLAYAKFDNFEEVHRQWKNHFSTHAPHRETMAAIVAKFRETGSVEDKPRTGRPATATSSGMLQEIQEFVEKDPQISTREGSSSLGMSQTSYVRALKKLHFKCYLPQLVVQMNEDDFDRRQEFCEIWLTQLEKNPPIVDKIIWSDESDFKLSGSVNRHNCTYWARENPHQQAAVKHSNAGVMVWCGMTSSGLIGPYFFETSVTGQAYVDMLENFLWPKVMRRGLYFQHDGAPAHYSSMARTWLDKKFPRRWVGRRGPFEWPARSPDLTPCDFFLWGHLKDIVYRTPPDNIPQLRERIKEACQQVTEEMCSNVCQSVPERLRSCLALEGHQLRG
jgi:hypothetical protein